jgi:hypothetical protein
MFEIVVYWLTDLLSPVHYGQSLSVSRALTYDVKTLADSIVSFGFRYCTSRIRILAVLSVVSIRLCERFSKYPVPVDDKRLHRIWH